MTRAQQIGVAVAALFVILFLMPSGPGSVISVAPDLPSGFNAVAQAESMALTANLSLQQAPARYDGGALPVEGGSTITLEKIQQVLAEYNSPAQGHAQAFIDYGQKYNINPAIALAFFIHESSAGSNPAWAGRKSDGTYTHNVGNIICTGNWRCYGRFRDYDSWDQGIEDWYKLIRYEYIEGWQRSTVDDIIPKYAPAADNNNEGAYIQAVKDLVLRWQGQ